MPQDQADLATYGNKEVHSLVDYFHHFFTDDEKQRIIKQWPILRQRLARQKMYKTLDVFSNILMPPPDEVKDCLVLIDLLITLSPSTAKCEHGNLGELQSFCKQGNVNIFVTPSFIKSRGHN